MSKKRKKKKYNEARSLRLVCLEHRRLWKDCNCSGDKCTFILVNERELEVFYNTGKVPNWKAELYAPEGYTPEFVNPEELGFDVRVEDGHIFLDSRMIFKKVLDSSGALK